MSSVCDREEMRSTPSLQLSFMKSTYTNRPQVAPRNEMSRYDAHDVGTYLKTISFHERIFSATGIAAHAGDTLGGMMSMILPVWAEPGEARGASARFPCEQNTSTADSWLTKLPASSHGRKCFLNLMELPLPAAKTILCTVGYAEQSPRCRQAFPCEWHYQEPLRSDDSRISHRA